MPQPYTENQQAQRTLTLPLPEGEELDQPAIGLFAELRWIIAFGNPHPRPCSQRERERAALDCSPPVTNVARTIVDCFKFRNKIGTDVAVEALQDAWRKKRFTMKDLSQNAKVFRMTRVMTPYLF